MGSHGHKLCAGKLALALGLVWGVSVFLLGLSTMWFGYGAAWVRLLASVYIGFTPTFFGSIIGLIYGFVDFFVFGFVVALVYNCCCSGRQCCPHRSKSDK